MRIVIETVESSPVIPKLYTIEIHGRTYERYPNQYKHEVIRILQKILEDAN